MLNSQVSMEAIYSGTYVQNYLDCVENLPNDVQRHLTRIRELDCSYRAYLREIEVQTEILDINVNKRAKAITRIQKALIGAQEVGDEKLQVVQKLQDLIENHTKRLDFDYKNLDYGKDEPISEQKETIISANNPSTNINNSNNPSSSNMGNQPVSNSVIASSSSNNNERQSKRARRTRQDNYTNSIDQNSQDLMSPTQEYILRSATTPVQTAISSQKKTATCKTGATGKKKKRKTRASAMQTATQRNNNTNSNVGNDSPVHGIDDDQIIDPDEPTYCLCDQISYGEMILCDNDLCPIEWFHFSCVALTTKPKGKWFCPKCRADRSNVMKPKQQFLKELERYNKEKEEKT